MSSEAAALPAERPVNWKELALLLLMALAILLPGISSLPPVDRDEPRYAVATTQMLASHNFVDIRYQDQPRYLQPAGIYWLQAIPTALFSAPGHRHIWTYRIASLLGALFAVGMTAWASSRMFGRKVGLAAGVFLASCLSLGFEARIGKTDAALLAAVVTAQFALMRLYLSPGAGWRTPAVFWAAVGIAILLKGPIILLVCGLTIVALLLWDRRAAWLTRLKAWWGVPLALLIAAPWYIAIGLASHGLFYRIAIGKSMMGKVSAGQQAHGAPFGYHLAGFPLTFWPASLLAVLAIPFVWTRRREPEVRFLIAWIAPSWIVFESIKTKLPHYVLPLFPAIALLAALALYNPRTAVKPWLKALAFLFAALWLVASGALSVLSPTALWLYQHRIDALAVALSLASLACVGVLAWAVWRRREQAVVASVAAASLFTALNLYMLGLPKLDDFWISRRVVALTDRLKPCPDDRLITTPFHEPSLVFLHGPDRTILAENPAEAADRLSKTQACGLALVNAPEEAAFLARAKADGLGVRAIGEVKGKDYADGHAQTLTLFAAAAGS